MKSMSSRTSRACTQANMHHQYVLFLLRNENLLLLPSLSLSLLVVASIPSGYSGSVKPNVPTGKAIETLENIHAQHINVLKFAFNDPNLFCTSSFDKTVKLWDLRQRRQCIFEQRSTAGVVMICFSPDDRYILSSAVDNEVRQYTTSGAEVLRYDLKQLQSSTNYTRAYFMNGSDYIITGSCEESVVKVCDTTQGRILADIDFAGNRYGPSASLSAPCMPSVVCLRLFVTLIRWWWCWSLLSLLYL